MRDADLMGREYSDGDVPWCVQRDDYRSWAAGLTLPGEVVERYKRERGGTVDDSLAWLMSMGESCVPMIEWAEGQKTMMLGRGWSPHAAEEYALMLLTSAVRLVFNAHTA